MRVTLTRDLGTHRKGDTHDVSDATAKRLIAKGAAKETKAKQDDPGQRDDGDTSEPDQG